MPIRSTKIIPSRRFLLMMPIAAALAPAADGQAGMSFRGAGGTLAIFIPSNSGLVIAADKRQSPKGVFCDGINKILLPSRPSRTAVVITGNITLQDMPDLPAAERCEYLAKTPAPIDFGKTTLAFLNSEGAPVRLFNGQKFTDAIFQDIDPYLRAGNLRAFYGSRVAVIVIASYDPATRTSSMLAFGADIDAVGVFRLQPLHVTASTTVRGAVFGLDHSPAMLPFGEVAYFNEHVLVGAGKAFLGDGYSELLCKTSVSEVSSELASAVALNLIDAAARTAEEIPPPSGIGGGTNAVLLGTDTIVLK